jgi:hypothetical protein
VKGKKIPNGRVLGLMVINRPPRFVRLGDNAGSLTLYPQKVSWSTPNFCSQEVRFHCPYYYRGLVRVVHKGHRLYMWRWSFSAVRELRDKLKLKFGDSISSSEKGVNPKTRNSKKLLTECVQCQYLF